MLQRETEKLRNDIEKMRSEVCFIYYNAIGFNNWYDIFLMLSNAHWNRYEIDKVIAGQCLDLNLERG